MSDDTRGDEQSTTGSGTTGSGAERDYDPAQDPDSDPDMLREQHPASVGENERDPAEGPDDASATDG